MKFNILIIDYLQTTFVRFGKFNKSSSLISFPLISIYCNVSGNHYIYLHFILTALNFYNYIKYFKKSNDSILLKLISKYLVKHYC